MLTGLFMYNHVTQVLGVPVRGGACVNFDLNTL